MSDDSKSNTSSNASVNPAADAVTAFWTQWMEQSSRGTQALLELLQEAGDPEQIQRRWLDAVAQSLDSFMRSPAFLETMKQHLKTMTELKGVQGHVNQGTARQPGMPLADDITGLFERLNSTERTILDRLQAIEDRFKDIEPKH